MWHLSKQLQDAILDKFGLKRYIIIHSIILCIVVIITFIAFMSLNQRVYIALEPCERLVVESVIVNSNTQPIYLAYKDCSIPPKRTKIEHYVFIER